MLFSRKNFNQRYFLFRYRCDFPSTQIVAFLLTQPLTNITSPSISNRFISMRAQMKGNVEYYHYVTEKRLVVLRQFSGSLIKIFCQALIVPMNGFALMQSFRFWMFQSIEPLSFRWVFENNHKILISSKKLKICTKKCTSYLGRTAGSLASFYSILL